MSDLYEYTIQVSFGFDNVIKWIVSIVCTSAITSITF